jgi:hypothetical protein
LQGTNPEPLMSALGQKWTLGMARPMSALPPKADVRHPLFPVPLCLGTMASGAQRRTSRERYEKAGSFSVFWPVQLCCRTWQVHSKPMVCGASGFSFLQAPLI